jgi:RNA polymerase sigma factor (sigma-70 family)
MATTPLTTVLGHLHGPAGEASDGQLLERFITHHEEAAFAALVRRYGPLVLGVCRRVLGNYHDAEDAFQATFLILVRKAADIVHAPALGGWLYQVAFRTASRARNAAGVRHRHERQAKAMAAPDDQAAEARQELAPVLDEEVNRLPEKIRLPFVLCYLEDKTHQQAARQLNCSVATLWRRLNRARQLLRLRLARRGLALSAGGLAGALAELPAAAAVPAALATATVRAALLGATGQALAAAGIAPQVAALAEGGLRAMALTKGKMFLTLALALTVLGTGLCVWAHWAWAGKAPPGREPPAAAHSRIAPRPLAHPKLGASPVAGDRMTVAGRVRDAAGRPVAGTHVAVVGREVADYRRGEGYLGPTVLGKGQADRRGRFRLVVPRTSQDRFWSVTLLAGSPGHALALVDLDVDAKRPEVDVQLDKEQAVRGRLFDVQGQPVKGVQVEVLAVFRSYEEQGRYQGVHFHNRPTDLPAWPRPAMTDGQGRFAFRGIGPDWSVQLHTRDGRFARQHRESLARERKGGKEIAWALAPARTVEGTVTYADTGKPAPHARLHVDTSLERLQGDIHHLDGRADGRGRFRLVLPEGNYVTIQAYPPAGQPYLIQSQTLTWARGDVIKKGVKLSLPRGLLVRGTVTEKPSGRSVAGATVEFVRFVDDNPFFNARGRSPIAVTSAGGRFEMAVVPGPGHLLIKGPTPDFLHEEIGSRQLYGRKFISNWQNYVDAAVALNLKPNSGLHEVAATLRRGVTIRGTVVRPDGRPVARAYLVSRTYLLLGYTLNGVQPRLVKEGRFDLPGCDPDGTVRAFFLDARNRLGAVAELSGKQAGQPVTVRLRPCGSARVRFVDGKGNPFRGVYPGVGIPLTPGAPFQVNKGQKPLAGVAHLDDETYRPDAQGRVQLPALIPGATLWLSGLDANRVYFAIHKEFKVEAGKTIDLGDIVVKKQGEG